MAWPIEAMAQKQTRRKKMKLLKAVSFILLPFVLAFLPDFGTTAFAAEDDMVQDATGTDPRDFGSKFMPYYRYMKLENEVEVNMATLFGMYAFNPRFAMTYEWPLAKKIDYSDVDEFKELKLGKPQNSDLPPVGPLPGGGGGLPFTDLLEDDGDVTGMGDLNLRFFLRPRAGEWKFWGGEKQMSLMPVLEMTFPTATEDLLGDESYILSPGITFVTDMPFKSPPLGLGFLALMNFYDFDAFKDDNRPYTSRFRGRWFWMQPLSKPAFADNAEDKDLHIFDLTGLYLLTEFQPVYDFRESDFSFWVGPELGKIIRDGEIFYLKPGWGIDNSERGDREFTFEVGFRYFL
jgi:hypothetical protein